MPCPMSKKTSSSSSIVCLSLSHCLAVSPRFSHDSCNRENPVRDDLIPYFKVIQVQKCQKGMQTHTHTSIHIHTESYVAWLWTFQSNCFALLSELFVKHFQICTQTNRATYSLWHLHRQRGKRVVRREVKGGGTHAKETKREWEGRHRDSFKLPTTLTHLLKR